MQTLSWKKALKTIYKNVMIAALNICSEMCFIVNCYDYTFIECVYHKYFPLLKLSS